MTPAPLPASITAGLVLCLVFLCGSVLSAHPPCPAGISPTLCDQRYAAAEAWLLRSNSLTALNAAFDDYATPTITHDIQDVGKWSGIVLAKEYDRLVVGLEEVLGYAPIVLRSTFDASTTRWESANVLRVDSFYNLTTNFDFNTGTYLSSADGIRDLAWFTFESGTARIDYDYSIQDPAAVAAFGTLDEAPETICAFMLGVPDFLPAACPASASALPGSACPNGNCQALTGYTTFEECVGFLTALASGPPSPCPYPSRSNTTACRFLHTLSSYFLPQVHCPHAAVTNQVCKDTCLDGPCQSLIPGARCDAQWPNLPLDYTLNYAPGCKTGFSGDGVTSCVPNTCNTDADCPSNVGVCNAGLCGCPVTFVWDPSLDAQRRQATCKCPFEHQRYVDGAAGPLCIRQGQCRSKHQCPQAKLGQGDTVECRPYGPNPFQLVPVSFCLCNYGYSGGVEYPCTCEAPRREVQSRSTGGSLCLAPNECVHKRQCQASEVCVIPSGALWGTCQAQ